MKITLVVLVSFIFFLGCSSPKKMIHKDTMNVESATFHHWSNPPKAGSDLPERGTDLEIILNGWPETYTPAYVVYEQRKSLTAAITDTSGNNTVITARIVRSSSVLEETSETVVLSNRLVFTDDNGKAGFIEIEEWERAEE